MKYRNMAVILPISVLSIGCSTDDIVSLVTDDEKKEIVQFSGKVIDGYISNADVFIDLNNNGVMDGDEPSTTSDENGSYSFDEEIKSGNYKVIAQNGTDEFTGKLFTGKLIAVLETDDIIDSENIIVSPISTLVAEKYFENSAISLEEAKKDISDSLNITSTNDILTTDFIEKEDTNLFIANQNVMEAIETLSALASKSENIDDGYGTAINTILETGSLDSTTNMNKISEILEVSFVSDLKDNSTQSESANMPFANNGEIVNDIVSDNNQSSESEDFLTFAKTYQENREADAERTKILISGLVLKPDSKESLELPVTSGDKTPPPFLDDDLRSDVLKNSDKLQLSLNHTFDELLKKSSGQSIDSFEATLSQYLNIETGKLNIPSLTYFKVDEDIDREFEKIGNDLELVEESIDKFTDNLENDFSDLEDDFEVTDNLFNNINIKNISELATQQTLKAENGEEFTLNLVEDNIVEFALSQDNGLIFNGQLTLEVDENGDILSDWSELDYENVSGEFINDKYDLKFSTVDKVVTFTGVVSGNSGSKADVEKLSVNEKDDSFIFVGTIIASNESSISGEIRASDLLSSFKGKFESPIDEVSFDGFIELKFKKVKVPVALPILYNSDNYINSADISLPENLPTDKDLKVGITAVSQYADMETYKKEQEAGLEIYKTDLAEDYSEYKNEINGEYAEYGFESHSENNMTAFSSTEYAETMYANNVEHSEEINVRPDFNFGTHEVTKFASITVICSLKVKTSNMQIDLNGDEQVTHIKDFSLTRGDDVSISFANAEIENQFNDIDKPFSKSDFFELSETVVMIKPLENDENTMTPVDGNIIDKIVLDDDSDSDTPDTFPNIPSLKRLLNNSVELTNAPVDASIPPPLPENMDMCEKDSDEADNCITESNLGHFHTSRENISIKDLDYSVKTESGSTISFKGSFESSDGFENWSRTVGTTTVDDISMSGTSTLSVSQIKVISTSDLTINSDMFKNLKYNQVDDMKKGILTSIEMEDGYQIFIKNEIGAKITVVDSLGNFLEK